MIKTSFNGLNFELNKESFIATIISANNDLINIEIPRSVIYQSQEYVIKFIGKLSFAYHKTINTVTFSSNSDLQVIDDEAFTHSSLHEISIPSSVTRIGKSVFHSCEDLTEVTISTDSKLTIIDKMAFYFCGIKTFYLPQFVTKISKASFDSCSEMTTFIIPENSKLTTIDKGAFAWTPIEFLFFPADLHEFGEDCFCSTTKLEKVKISPQNKYLKYLDDDEMIVIGKSDLNSDLFDVLVFASRFVQTLTIPSFIRHIGKTSASGCQFLKYVFFEKESNLISIDEGAFSHSTLHGIKIPSSCIQIKKNAFARAESMQVVLFENDSKLEYIGQHAFAFTPVIHFFFPPNIQTLEKEWCFYLDYLSEIILAPNIKYLKYFDSNFIIGKSDLKSDKFDSIFFARRDITHVHIPSFIKYIKSCAFANCFELEKVEFDEDSELEIIEGYAFSCTAITEIKIPKHVKIIHKNAFESCDNLENVEFHPDSELIKIGKFVFNCKSLATIEIPSKVEVIKQGLTSSYGQIRHTSVSPQNKKLKFVNEDLLIGKKDSKSDSFDSLIGSNDDFDEITIPSFVKHLNFFAFIYHLKLKVVNFEENSQLESIGVGAFELTSIKSITLPASLKIVERSAFERCILLGSIEFLSDEISIDSSCFDNSFRLNAVSFPRASKVKICYDAFTNQTCSLFVLPGVELIQFSSKYD